MACRFHRGVQAEPPKNDRAEVVTRSIFRVTCVRFMLAHWDQNHGPYKIDALWPVSWGHLA